MNLRFIVLLFLFGAMQCFSQADSRIEEVIVNADFFSGLERELPLSLSIVDAEKIRLRKAVHVEDILNTIPNVNFSSGASRGRFFQIRGTGERSQFVDPINYSVGLFIDGIDFTGVGGAASTLDVAQVEVLRGPQGTLFGANALAGAINIVTKAADESGGYVQLNLGDYNTREFSQALGGNISDSFAMRVAFSKNVTDGYIKNTYLNRSDTDNIDETTFRTKLKWDLGDQLVLDYTLLVLDNDNGYDAFSLDNTRETLSDEPGHDRLNALANGLKIRYMGDADWRWETSLSSLVYDSEYGYDEDWSYRTICPEGSACWQYSTKDNYERETINNSLDTRIVQEGDVLSWVIGVHLRQQDQELLRTYTNNDPGYDTFYGPPIDREVTFFSSDYQTENLALYSQASLMLGEDFSMDVGLRQEIRDAQYQDSNDSVLDTDETLWGGKLAFKYHGLENNLIYALVSRGYKAGGNNVPGPEDEDGNSLFELVFDTEFMWNAEWGIKSSWWDGRIQSKFNYFYQDREDMQVKQSVVVSRDTGEVNGDCPCDFEDYITNSPGAINYGYEFEIDAQLTPKLRIWFNSGYLQTKFEDFLSFSHVDADSETGEPYDLSGRAHAHAPSYQEAIGLSLAISENIHWYFDEEIKDAFYLSPRHNEKTQSYRIWNTRIEYRVNDFSLAFWGKNLTDEKTIVRGFGSFGNDPRKEYIMEPYYQYGTPRVLGVSATLNF